MEKVPNQIGGIPTEQLMTMLQTAIKNEMEQLMEQNRFGSEYKDEILSRKKTAALFRKTPDKISEMYERGEIPGFKTGREYFFLKSQLIQIFKYKK